MKKKCVIFYTKSEINDILILRLIKEYPKNIIAIVVLPILKTKKALLKNLFRNTISYALYKAINFYGYKIKNIISYKNIDPLKIAKKRGIKIIKSPSVNDLGLINYIREIRPDVIFNSTTQIYKKDILEIPKYGCINYHAAPLPAYRGLNPFIMQVINKEKYITLSVHKMDTGIDTGDIYLQSKFDYSQTKSLLEIEKECAKIASNLFIKLLNQKIIPKKQSLKGASYYSYPTHEQIKKFKKIGYKLISFKDFLKNDFYIKC